jgi:hypothetical protein
MNASAAIQHFSPEPSALQRDVLRTILYFDVFRYPLSPGEIYQYLPTNSTSPADVHRACATPPLSMFLRKDDGLYFLPQPSSLEPNPVSDRRANERRARTFMKIARAMAWIVTRFPFVRGLGISGELSKGVVSKNGDIDFVVVTAPGRVWVVRTLLILFKKVFLLNRKKFFCVNHFIAEGYFSISERNQYTALEIATIIPLSNPLFFAHFSDHNPWIREYYPNLHSLPTSGAIENKPGLLQKFLEWPLNGTTGDLLDKRLMEWWRSVWRKRYRHLSEDKLRELFRTEESVSTAYAGDFLSVILREYSKRLAAFGLDDVTGNAS